MGSPCTGGEKQLAAGWSRVLPPAALGGGLLWAGVHVRGWGEHSRSQTPGEGECSTGIATGGQIQEVLMEQLATRQTAGGSADGGAPLAWWGPLWLQAAVAAGGSWCWWY